MRVRPLRCGVLTAPGEAFVAGMAGQVDLAVWAFLVEHPSGTVLFDTGMHPSIRDDAHGYLGGLAGLFTIDYGPDDDIGSRLARAEVAPDDVSIVVGSHLHFDHAGGNALIPNARLLLQRREWEHARTEEDGGGYVAADLDTGHDLHLVDGEHDVFGDGRVVCIPTFGHTPGHQSLLVRLNDGDLLLTADACYLRRSLEARALPAFGWDLDLQRDVLQRFADHESRGTTLVFGHDPVLSPAALALMHP